MNIKDALDHHEAGTAASVTPLEGRTSFQAPVVPEMGELVDVARQQQLDYSQVFGAIKALEVQRQFISIATIKALARLKESKAYKGMQVLIDGKVIKTKRWEDVCNSLGLSVDKVDEDIANLELFGEAFLEGSRQLGLGYRDIRRLRKLPDGDRTAVAAAIEEDIEHQDKDGILALIDNLAARHATKERDWEAERAELEKRADKSEARINAAVVEETKAIAKERNALIKERDALAAQLEEPTWAKSRELAAVIVERAEDISRMVTQLLKTLPADTPPPDLAQGMELAMFRLQQAGNTCWGRWQDRADGGVYDGAYDLPAWARDALDDQTEEQD